MKKVKIGSVALLMVVMLLANVSLSYSGSEGHGHAVHWGYTGDEGPEHWGHLKKEFDTCLTGKKQSPVNIEKTSKMELTDIQLEYQDVPLKIINNGHTIQINYPQGSSLTLNGKKYDLLQFHFHTPSEHRIDGKASDMEVHLVHKSTDNELAVLGVLMKKGRENDFIQSLWDNIPEEEGKEMTAEDVTINAARLLPDERSYFNYSGSLTTPPCSEGVNWNVLTAAIEVSEKQINRFQSIFNMNARPVQPLNKRVIQQNQ